MNVNIKKFSIRAKIISVIITIIVGIVTYALIGVFSLTTSTVIYDAFPKEFQYNPIYNSEQVLTIQVWNKAPLNLPFIIPSYSVSVVVDSTQNKSFAYFKGLGDQKCNFTDYSCDLGRIDSGEYGQLDIFLHPDGSNITLRINVYLNFFKSILATSKSYSLVTQGNGNYTIVNG